MINYYFNDKLKKKHCIYTHTHAHLVMKYWGEWWFCRSQSPSPSSSSRAVWDVHEGNGWEELGQSCGPG